ncbi:MAG: DUF3105 domain-containing protein [Caldilineaceae bacterium]
MSQQTGSKKSSRKNALRARAAQQRRRQNLILYGSIAAVVGAIALIFLVNYWSNRPVGDERVFTSQGNLHIPDGTAAQIKYNSLPPSSGPHYERIAGWGVYAEPLPYERLIHNLEDAGVVVYYQCETACPELVEQLKDVVQPFIDRGRHVVLAPNQPGRARPAARPTRTWARPLRWWCAAGRHPGKRGCRPHCCVHRALRRHRPPLIQPKLGTFWRQTHGMLWMRKALCPVTAERTMWLTERTILTGVRS